MNPRDGTLPTKCPSTPVDSPHEQVFKSVCENMWTKRSHFAVQNEAVFAAYPECAADTFNIIIINNDLFVSEPKLIHTFMGFQVVKGTVLVQFCRTRNPYLVWSSIDIQSLPNNLIS